MNPHPKTAAISAIGIDVGFFSTKFSVGRDKNRNNEIIVDQFPSQAPRSHISAGKKLPMSAELDGANVQVNGVPYFVGKDVFRMVETFGSRAVVADFSASDPYKALFLGSLGYVASHHGTPSRLVIKHLVLGLPMNTVYAYREPLKRMGEGRHEVPIPGKDGQTATVTVEEVTVIAQPQGALLSSGGRRRSKIQSDTTLVLDMGGGTFDWFVSEGLDPNYSRCGAAPIGMLKCAAAVCDMINADWRHDPKVLAKVDLALRTNAPTMRITSREYEMIKYRPAAMAVVTEALDQMIKSVGSLHNIDEILLTGGGAALLEVPTKHRLKDFAHMVKVDPEPVYSNVRGFHMLAELPTR